MAEEIIEDIKAIMVAVLEEACTDNYARYIADEITDEVMEDIKAANTIEDCTTYDIQLAVGRTLLKRLGISI